MQIHTLCQRLSLAVPVDKLRLEQRPIRDNPQSIRRLILLEPGYFFVRRTTATNTYQQFSDSKKLHTSFMSMVV